MRFTRRKLLTATAGLATLALGCDSRRPTVGNLVVPIVPTCVEQWVHMPVMVVFPTGSTVIDEENRVILSEIITTAQTRTDIRRIRVEGHVDLCGSQPDQNRQLALARAVAVAEAMVTMGVPRELIETVGYP